jgi:hypothetical protein
MWSQMYARRSLHDMVIGKWLSREFGMDKMEDIPGSIH